MKSWRLWLGTVVAICVGGVNGHLSKEGGWFSAGLMILVIMFLFSAMTIPESHQKEASGFPSYMFLLPLGDLQLVAWPMVLSAIFLALTGGAISLVILGAVAPLSETWWIAPYLAGNVCLFQAVTWLPLRKPHLRTMLSFVAVACISAGPIAFVLGAIWAVPAGLSYLVLMSVSIAVSVRGVGRARHGLAVVGSNDKANYRIPDLPMFPTRVSTQEWLEERMNGLVMKVLTSTFLILFGIIAIFAVPSNSFVTQVGGEQISINAIILAVLALAVPAYFGFGGCCGSERDNIAKDRSIVPFLALRPLTNLQIVEAKVRMSASLVLKLCLSCLGVALSILLLPTSTEEHYRPTLITLAHILTLRQALALMAWFCLIILGGIKAAISGIWFSLGRLPLWTVLVFCLLPLGLILGVVGRLVSHTDEIPRFLEFLPYLIWVFTALKIAALATAIRWLRKLKLVPGSLILKWCVGCAVAGVIIFALACMSIPPSAYSRWAIAAQIFCMLPLVRVAMAPLFVHRGRHG